MLPLSSTLVDFLNAGDYLGCFVGYAVWSVVCALASMCGATNVFHQRAASLFCSKVRQNFIPASVTLLNFCIFRRCRSHLCVARLFASAVELLKYAESRSLNALQTSEHAAPYVGYLASSFCQRRGAPSISE